MKIAALDLLAELIFIAEKSAQISRLCRSNDTDDLFNILIQEKKNDSKNPRFVHDFKTFADVLIQEVAKNTLELKFPGLSNRVYGEEDNRFENKLGESITVRIGANLQQTTEMLVKILNGNEVIANSLANVIYSPDDSSLVETLHASRHQDLKLDLNNIGIWIDPIDSTSEYINGRWSEQSSSSAIISNGLQCVTCLFGVFDTRTGLPLMGVLHQPFYKQVHDDTRRQFAGRLFWGYNIEGVCGHSMHTNTTEQRDCAKPVLVGGKESNDLLAKLSAIAPTLYVAGAGYKLLCLIEGQSGLLVTSSQTTFFWDTCAGHAVLRSLGGGIIALSDLALLRSNKEQYQDLEQLQLRYRPKQENGQLSSYNHAHGMIAYISKQLIYQTAQLL